MTTPKWNNKRATFEVFDAVLSRFTPREKRLLSLLAAKVRTKSYDVDSGSGFRLRATDFGNLGIRIELSHGNEIATVIVEPEKMDDLINWLSLATNRPVVSLPPMTREVIRGLLLRNKTGAFLTCKEKRTLREALTQLRSCEKIRTKEGDLLARARNRVCDFKDVIEQGFCECGCGTRVSEGKRFVHGHHARKYRA